MFEVNNRNTRTKCKICSKLTIKIPERREKELTRTWKIHSRSELNFETFYNMRIANMWMKVLGSSKNRENQSTLKRFFQSISVTVACLLWLFTFLEMSKNDLLFLLLLEIDADRSFSSSEFLCKLVGILPLTRMIPTVFYISSIYISFIISK